MKRQETDDIKILLIGIGNSGRSDDALGWKLAEMISELKIEGVYIEYRYQLQVEDAFLVSEYDVVIFADATVEKADKGFWFSKCIPGDNYYFSSHQQSPQAILYLSNELYGKFPDAWILAISGSDWDLGEKMSDYAKDNLLKAFEQLQAALLKATSKDLVLSN